MAASNIKNMMTEINLKCAFDLFDLDQNGEITPRELRHVLANKNQDIVDQEWEELICEFDENNDGQINFSEFKKMMLNMH